MNDIDYDSFGRIPTGNNQENIDYDSFGRISTDHYNNNQDQQKEQLGQLNQQLEQHKQLPNIPENPSLPEVFEPPKLPELEEKNIINTIENSKNKSVSDMIPLVKKGLNIVPNATINVAKDIGNIFKNIPQSIAKGVGKIPEGINYLKKEIPLSYNQIKNNPERAGRNVLAGGVELLGDISRIPNMLPDYLAHIGMIPLEIASKIPRPPTEEQVSDLGNKIVGGQQKEGDKFIRNTIKNLPEIYGVSKLAKILNPSQLTSKSIAKDILKTEKLMKEKYSGKNGLYTNLFREAENKGIGEVKVNPEKIKFDTIKEYTSEKYYKSTEDFLNKKSLENAQKSISDLGHLERTLEKKEFLLQPEKNLLSAVKETKSNIANNMFKDSEGKLNEHLFNKHKAIQKGYATEVIPYTENRNIKKFKLNKLSSKELINRLSKGEFRAQRGKHHKTLKLREMKNNIFGNKLTQSGLLGTGIAGSMYLMNKLLGKSD